MSVFWQCDPVSLFSLKDFRNSAPTTASREPCSSPDNIWLPDIIYVYTLSRCSRYRRHSFLFFFFNLLLHIVLNFSLKVCTTWWWPPLWPKHVVVSYRPPQSHNNNNNIVVFDYFIHSLYNMTQHFIRLQMEGTASRCGG